MTAETEEEFQDRIAKEHCMCGLPIDHSAWEGHTPVSMYDYYRQQDQEREAARIHRAILSPYPSGGDDD